MQAVQMKYQRIMSVGCLVLASVMILYSLGFSTDLYSLSYHANPSSTLFYVEGAELYLIVQPFNRAFLTHTLLYFIVCLSVFLSLTHRRRLYYASNYITSIVLALSSVALGVEVYANVQKFRELYLKIDFAKLREVTESMKMEYVQSTRMLDIGVWLSVLLILAAIALGVNLVLKTHWMRREHWADDATPAAEH